MMTGSSEAVSETLANKGIQEILHFTKGQAGLTGILSVRAVQSRKRLERDNRLAYIFEPNAQFRKDHAWLDYVNLSISEINSQFFAASGRWHKAVGNWWVILSFDPLIAAHSGVYFATTNNFYTGVCRAQGDSGLNALFADQVTQWPGNVVRRERDIPSYLTTCEQAEVLYPGEVSTDFLKKIYVRNGDDLDDARAQLEVFNHHHVEVIVDPKRFLGRSKT